MESRKIIKLGNSSFAIALPKPWVDKSGLKKGDSIYVLPNATGELILTPSYQENGRNKTIKLDITQLKNEAVVQELRSAYVQDHDIIEINGIAKTNIEIVKNVIQEMLGFEVIESEEKKIVLKDFFNMHEAALENFLRKIDNSIRSMFEDLLSFIKLPIKEKQLTEMYTTDTEINKFSIFITRVLFKGLKNPALLNILKLDSRNLFEYWWISFNLEHIADDLKRISKLLKNKEFRRIYPQFIFEMTKKISDCYTKTLNCYYKKDRNLAILSLKGTNDLVGTFNELSRHADGTRREIIIKLSYINRSIYEINKILLYTTL